MTFEQHQVLDRITVLYKRLAELGDSDPHRGMMLLGLIDAKEYEAFSMGITREAITVHVNMEMKSIEKFRMGETPSSHF